MATTRDSNAAMRYLDQAVVTAAVVSHFGRGFYGAPNDGLIEPVHMRQYACPAPILLVR